MSPRRFHARSVALLAIVATGARAGRAGAQDRLPSMPGYDRYLQMLPAYQGAVRLGSVRLRHGGGEDAALGAQLLGETLQGCHETSAKAAAAASTVRAMCSAVWAVDGNQASNCEAGGYTPRASRARHQAP